VAQAAGSRQENPDGHGFSEPLAYGLLKSPGSLGADIVCGEGQSLGIPQSFGGPGWACSPAAAAYVRTMPGRLVGKTVDVRRQTRLRLTLATREQHIRREKATSNICTNQGLCATAATMYMAALGGSGIRELARLNRDKAEYLKTPGGGLTSPFTRPPSTSSWSAFPGLAATYQPAAGEKDRGRAAPGTLLPGAGRPLPAVRDRNLHKAQDGPAGPRR
jgi:glycine dehydrogenase subunit 1